MSIANLNGIGTVSINLYEATNVNSEYFSATFSLINIPVGIDTDWSSVAITNAGLVGYTPSLNGININFKEKGVYSCTIKYKATTDFFIDSIIYTRFHDISPFTQQLTSYDIGRPVVPFFSAGSIEYDFGGNIIIGDTDINKDWIISAIVAVAHPLIPTVSFSGIITIVRIK